MVRRGEVQLVIVAKLDRLTRSVRDLAELLELFQKRNVSLVSVAESLDTGSAGGRLVLNIMAQSRSGSAKRSASVPRRRYATSGRNCRVFNHEPYGFRGQATNLCRCPRAGAIITHEAWRDAGWTLRSIANELNLRHPTKRGVGRWHAQTVKDIMDSDLHRREAA